MKKTNGTIKTKKHQLNKAATTGWALAGDTLLSQGTERKQGLRCGTVEQAVDMLMECREQQPLAVITVHVENNPEDWNAHPRSKNDLGKRFSRDVILLRIREMCFPNHPNNSAKSDAKCGHQA